MRVSGVWHPYVCIYIYRLRLCRRPLFSYSFISYMGVGTICYVPLDSHRNSAFNPLVEMTFQWFSCFSCFLQHGTCWIMRFWYRWLHMAPYGCIQMHTDAFASCFIWFPLIFIGSHWSQQDLRPSGARGLAGLWRALAACGSLWQDYPSPLRWCNKARCILQYR